MKEIPVIRGTDLAGILLESVRLAECVFKFREYYVRAVPGIRTEHPRLIARLSADDGFFHTVRINPVYETRILKCERTQA